MLESDIEPMMPLFREHFEAVNMKRRLESFDEMTVLSTTKNYARSPFYQTLIAVKDNEYLGVIVFVVARSQADSKLKRAAEILWYAKSKKIFLELFKRIEKILIEKSYNIAIGFEINNKALEKFLTKKGYIQNEIVLIKNTRGD